MLVGVLSKVVPVGRSAATVLSAADQARLDRAFLVPHQWASHYASRYGGLEDFLRRHPERFAIRPDGAVYQLEPPPVPVGEVAGGGAEDREDGVATAAEAAATAAGTPGPAGAVASKRKVAGAERRSRESSGERKGLEQRAREDAGEKKVAKAGSKGIPSCPCSTPWGNTARLRRPRVI